MDSIGYHCKNSALHRLDARYKLLILLGAGLSVLQAGKWDLALLTGLLLALIPSVGLRFGVLLKELRLFLLLLLLLVLSRALSADGPLVWQWQGIGLSRQGLYQGGLISWRLLLLVIMGLLLMASTRVGQIRGAVVCLLRPIPWIPEKRVGTMLALLLSFLPLLLRQVREIQQAQQARGMDRRKNPLYRLIKLGLPWLRKSLEQADRRVMALEARAYSEDRSLPCFSATRTDQLTLLAACGFCLLILGL